MTTIAETKIKKTNYFTNEAMAYLQRESASLCAGDRDYLRSLFVDEYASQGGAKAALDITVVKMYLAVVLIWDDRQSWRFHQKARMQDVFNLTMGAALVAA